jgi:hypothetical protein
VPPLAPGALKRLSEVLRITASLVADLGGFAATEQRPAHEHREVQTVTDEFERINKELEKAKTEGRVSAELQRSIGRHLHAAGEAIEKGAI